jgi:hypothetical protein
MGEPVLAALAALDVRDGAAVQRWVRALQMQFMSRRSGGRDEECGRLAGLAELVGQGKAEQANRFLARLVEVALANSHAHESEPSALEAVLQEEIRGSVSSTQGDGSELWITEQGLLVQLLLTLTPGWRQAAIAQRPSHSTFSGIHWQVRRTVASDSCKRLSEPSVIVDLESSQAPKTCYDMPEQESTRFELTRENLDAFLGHMETISAHLDVLLGKGEKQQPGDVRCT